MGFGIAYSVVKGNAKASIRGISKLADSRASFLCLLGGVLTKTIDIMKHKLFFFAVLMMVLALPQSVKAYDFSAVAPTGQTLYYNIVGGNAQVTYRDYYHGYLTNPTENLTIPSSVTYAGNTYT